MVKKIKDYQDFFGEEGECSLIEINTRFTFHINDRISCLIYSDKWKNIYLIRFMAWPPIFWPDAEISIEELLESDEIDLAFKEKILFNLDLFRA